MRLSWEHESSVPADDVDPRTHGDDPQAAEAVLTDALARAAEHRLAAEQLLEQMRMLEDRIGAEVVQAQRAGSNAERERLTSMLADARAREQAAREHSRRSMRALEERAMEATRVKETLQELRRIEAAARAVADEAAAELDQAHHDREQIENELNALNETVPETPAGAPSLAVIDELRALEARIGLSPEAAKRVAERRLADAARRQSIPNS